jgi:hypothetical protein
MLTVVKHINLSTHCLGGYEERILWHISSPVHFSLMIDLLYHLNLSSYEPSVTTVSSNP